MEGFQTHTGSTALSRLSQALVVSTQDLSEQVRTLVAALHTNCHKFYRSRSHRHYTIAEVSQKTFVPRPQCRDGQPLFYCGCRCWARSHNVPESGKLHLSVSEAEAPQGGHQETGQGAWKSRVPGQKAAQIPPGCIRA